MKLNKQELENKIKQLENDLEMVRLKKRVKELEDKISFEENGYPNFKHPYNIHPCFTNEKYPHLDTAVTCNKISHIQDEIESILESEITDEDYEYKVGYFGK